MFLLTTYIFPLESPIPISERLNFYLDNPRTKEEIKIVEDYLNATLNCPPEVRNDFKDVRIPVKSTEENRDPTTFTLESALKYFRRAYGPTDPYIDIFFDKNMALENAVQILAKIWIIARIPDEEKTLNRKERQAAITIMPDEPNRPYMINKNDPLIINGRNFVQYSFLLSLLINTEDNQYEGHSFLLHHNMVTLFFPRYDWYLNSCVLRFCMRAVSTEINKKKEQWHSFNHIKTDLIQAGKIIDAALDDSNKEKILYVAGLLETVGFNLQDERMRLVTLVSIIELLLVNGAGQQSRQFREKASDLIAKQDNNHDPDQLKSRLKLIYQQRSNIAHGNFKSLQKFLKKELEKQKTSIDQSGSILREINRELYFYLKKIIQAYLEDRHYVDALKKAI